MGSVAVTGRRARGGTSESCGPGLPPVVAAQLFREAFGLQERSGRVSRNLLSFTIIEHAGLSLGSRAGPVHRPEPCSKEEAPDTLEEKPLPLLPIHTETSPFKFSPGDLRHYQSGCTLSKGRSQLLQVLLDVALS